MVIYILMFIVMLILSVQDIKNKEISAKLLVVSAIISLVGAFIGVWKNNLSITDVVVSLLPGVGMLFLSFATRQQIGYGDGLVTLVLGPAFGIWTMLLGIVIAFFGSSIFSIILLLLKKAEKKTRIPFVPFITLGTAVACFAKI